MFFIMSGFLGLTETSNFCDLTLWLIILWGLQFCSKFVVILFTKYSNIYLSCSDCFSFLLNEYVNRSSTLRLCGLCCSVNMQVHVSLCSFFFCFHDESSVSLELYLCSKFTPKKWETFFNVSKKRDYTQSLSNYKWPGFWSSSYSLSPSY